MSVKGSLASVVGKIKEGAHLVHFHVAHRPHAHLKDKFEWCWRLSAVQCWLASWWYTSLLGVRSASTRLMHCEENSTLKV